MALLRRLGVAGVVAGHNYRFGYRAAGDAAALRALCASAGLRATIVEMVTAEGATDATDTPPQAPDAAPACALQVSSTRVRAALALGDTAAAAELLGRPHRWVLAADAAGAQCSPSGGDGALLLPRGAARNQPPREGRVYGGSALALSLDDAAGAPLWRATADAAAVEALPGGGARVALRGERERAALGAALAAAPPGATMRIAADL